MGVPYATPPEAGLAASSGSTCFPIRFASRAYITRILIKQTSGSPGAFTVALYSNSGACGGHPQSESEGPVGGVIPTDLYRVTPDLSGTAGALLYFSELSNGGSGFPFINQDPPDGRPFANKTVYVNITHSLGAGIKFAISIAGEVFGDN